MKRDTTQIDFQDYNFIIDDQTIETVEQTAPTMYQTKTYKLINDKYLLTKTTSGDSVSLSTQNYTQTQIQDLPSRYDVASPIFHGMAIVSILLITYFAYKLIIYPWFRKI